MQTRKRAKSVMFGKKVKEEKEPVKEVHASSVDDTSPEKAETVERRTVPEKTQPEGLSTTLPKGEAVSEAPTEESANATPASEFITENPLASSPDHSEISATQEGTQGAVEEKEEKASEPVGNEVSPVSPVSEPTEPAAASPDPSASAATPELSATPPQSAFSIQSDEKSVAVPTEGGKKKFVVYFLVIALAAFILGLGAMAVFSYLGLFNKGLPQFSPNIQVPALPGTKPTPTAVPAPTATPTPKPVNLTSYTITILNGSGVTGEAGKVKDSLTTAGFKVGTTGNAANNDFTKTEIAAKKSVDPAYLNKLEDELKKSFVVGPSVTTAADSSTSDVTVTLGSQTP